MEQRQRKQNRRNRIVSYKPISKILLTGLLITAFTVSSLLLYAEEPTANEIKNTSFTPVMPQEETSVPLMSGLCTEDYIAQSSIDPINVYNKDLFSPTVIGNDWSSLDHIGYKDGAFSGERHIAYNNPGIIMSGYAMPAYADFMVRKFETGDHTINVIQAPYRADWHTFCGNGVLFNLTLSSEPEAKDYIAGESYPSIKSGYFICATESEIILYDMTGVNLSSLANDTTILENLPVIYSQPKHCNAQNFTIVYKGGNAIIYLSGKKIYEGALNDGAYNGLLSCYKEHNCTSLSSIYFNNFTYNGVDYLKEVVGE